jgi:hypothetical protein
MDQLEQLAAEGPLGGPAFRYRGAEIRCHKGGHVCILRMDGHLLDGHSFGAPAGVMRLVDLWADGARLPDHMRVVPAG